MDWLQSICCRFRYIWSENISDRKLRYDCKGIEVRAHESMACLQMCLRMWESICGRNKGIWVHIVWEKLTAQLWKELSIADTKTYLLTLLQTSILSMGEGTNKGWRHILFPFRWSAYVFWIYVCVWWELKWWREWIHYLWQYSACCFSWDGRAENSYFGQFI